jgi:hypothetical protein
VTLGWRWRLGELRTVRQAGSDGEVLRPGNFGCRGVAAGAIDATKGVAATSSREIKASSTTIYLEKLTQKRLAIDGALSDFSWESLCTIRVFRVTSFAKNSRKLCRERYIVPCLCRAIDVCLPFPCVDPPRFVGIPDPRQIATLLHIRRLPPQRPSSRPPHPDDPSYRIPGLFIQLIVTQYKSRPNDFRGTGYSYRGHVRGEFTDVTHLWMGITP